MHRFRSLDYFREPEEMAWYTSVACLLSWKMLVVGYEDGGCTIIGHQGISLFRPQKDTR